jgi:hypothetical protein
MNTRRVRLSKDYRPAFLRYLNHPGEQSLHAAYELGRAAFADRVSLLDVIRIHHTVVGQVLQGTTDPQDVQEIVNAAAGFLVEALAPYEMARQGFFDRSRPGSQRAEDPAPTSEPPPVAPGEHAE